MGSKPQRSMPSKPAIVDFDDLCDTNDPYDLLLRMWDKVPDFKCTLFAIPTRMNDALLAKYDSLKDRVALGIHGWRHARSECMSWTAEETAKKIELAQAIYPGFAPIFKAPNWEIDVEGYEGCKTAGIAVADHVRNIEIIPSGLPHYIYNVRLRNDAYRRYHGHIQNWAGTGFRESFDQYAAIKGPFAFVHEVAKASKELAL